MVTVVFHFTDWEGYPGGDTPKNTMPVWVQDVTAFGVDRIIMIDKTTFKIGQYYVHAPDNIKFERYDSLEECMEKYPDGNWVFIETNNNGKNLMNFEHPKENCFYVVGSDLYSIKNIKYEPTHWVEIPMVNYSPLYAHPAMMVVLYDRMIKLK